MEKNNRKRGELICIMVIMEGEARDGRERERKKDMNFMSLHAWADTWYKFR